MADRLTDKQKKFADEYLIDLNGTQAYQRVYGCKESTARINASKLLTNTNITDYIQAKQKKLEIKVEWTVGEILKDIKTIAQNPTNETRDRLRAYELGGKHLGMFKEEVKLSGGLDNTNKDTTNTTDPDQLRKEIDEMIQRRNAAQK